MIGATGKFAKNTIPEVKKHNIQIKALIRSKRSEPLAIQN